MNVNKNAETCIATIFQEIENSLPERKRSKKSMTFTITHSVDKENHPSSLVGHWDGSDISIDVSHIISKLFRNLGSEATRHKLQKIMEQATVEGMLSGFAKSETSGQSITYTWAPKKNPSKLEAATKQKQH